MNRKHRRHQFVVIGQWPFPIDMLRYDRCYPATEEDARVISDLNDVFRTRAAASEPEIVPVDVVRCAPKDWKPHEERWRSFGWRIEDHVHTKIDD